MSLPFPRRQILSLSRPPRCKSPPEHGDSRQNTQTTLLGNHCLTKWTQQGGWGLFHGALRTGGRERTRLMSVALLPGLSGKASIFLRFQNIIYLTSLASSPPTNLSKTQVWAADPKDQVLPLSWCILSTVGESWDKHCVELN